MDMADIEGELEDKKR
jgi:Ca2+-binding EF-hand superfamily protein